MEEKTYFELTEVVTIYRVNKEAFKVGQVIGFKVNNQIQRGSEVLDNYSEAVGVIRKIWLDRVEVLRLDTLGTLDLWADSLSWRDIKVLTDVEKLTEDYKDELFWVF